MDNDFHGDTMVRLMSNVSIIIVNYNSGVMLDKCIASVTKQTVEPYKIVVVDNASSDGSSDKIEERHDQIEVIRLKENIGFAAANNVGVKAVGYGEWIVLLNPDAFPEARWLENLLQAAKLNPEYSFFASRMKDAQNNGILDGTGDVYHVSGRVWRRDHGAGMATDRRKTGEVFSACAAAAMYRTKDFLEVGGFDESYFCYSEDIDIGFRLRLLGHRCLYVNEAVVEHVGAAVTSRHSDFYIYHGHRNLVWTFVKNMPWPLFWVYLPQHLLLNLVSLIVFSLRGKGCMIIKAKWDALMGIPAMLRKRKEIQQSRKIGLWKPRQIMAKGLLSAYFSGGKS